MLMTVFNPAIEFILCICYSLILVKEYGVILYKVLRKELDLIKEYKKLSLIGIFGIYGNIAFLKASDFTGNYFKIASILCAIGIVTVIIALWMIKRKSHRG